MVYKTEAIVLSKLNYSESSLIVKAYTRDFGLQSYILRSPRKPNANAKAQHFQPLGLLELEISQTPGAKLHSIKSSRQVGGAYLAGGDMIRTSLAIFMAEVLNLSVKDSSPNEQLFDYLKETILSLFAFVEQGGDVDAASLADFHLHFLFDLATLLGFQPNDNYSEEKSLFDLQAGEFVPSNAQGICADRETSRLIHLFLSSDFASPTVKITSHRTQRRRLLDAMAKFYSIHVTMGRQIRSHEILSLVIG